MTATEYNFGTGETVHRELTAEEIAAIADTPAPNPRDSALKQIRALEAQFADAQAKVTRQALLMQTVAIGLASPAAATLTAGMTAEEAKAAVVERLLATDPGFKMMYELELQVEALRAQL